MMMKEMLTVMKNMMMMKEMLTATKNMMMMKEILTAMKNMMMTKEMLTATKSMMMMKEMLTAMKNMKMNIKMKQCKVRMMKILTTYILKLRNLFVCQADNVHFYFVECIQAVLTRTLWMTRIVS